MDDSLYKILTDSEWSSLKTTGSFLGTSVDVKDGYLHLSQSHQVAGVISRYYQGLRPLYIVEFSAKSFGDCLKWEAATSGELYPHVYGRTLLFSEVLSVRQEN